MTTLIIKAVEMDYNPLNAIGLIVLIFVACFTIYTVKFYYNLIVEKIKEKKFFINQKTNCK